jgi:hypothetical protein
MGVHIDQQCSFACFSEGTCQVYRYGCLAAAAFLIDNRYSSHSFSPFAAFGVHLFSTKKSYGRIYLFGKAMGKGSPFLWDYPIKTKNISVRRRVFYPLWPRENVKIGARGLFERHFRQKLHKYRRRESSDGGRAGVKLFLRSRRLQLMACPPSA